MATLYERASAYLFRPGGTYAIAICRIALFTYFYVHVFHDADAWIGRDASQYLQRSNIAAYYPKSIVWALFPSSPPPAWFIDLTMQVAQVSTILAVIGLFTRLSMIASTLSNLFLASLLFSWEPLWSHPYNSGLLAAIPFMFGRAGDRLSLDSLIATLWRGGVKLSRDAYWWPVILGQIGVAAVYFGGFYAKWSTPDFSFDFSWVFSDNLRNSTALPWLIRGQELPWYLGLIVNNPFVWKLCAAGHLATQAFPMLSIFSLKRPYLRLLEGLVFVSGVFLLKLIMGMWNPPWMILAAFFVDWDYFLERLGVIRADRTPTAISVTSKRAKAPVVALALSFVAANLVVIVFRLDDNGWNRAYPFSSMTFYSNVAASKPYRKHLHYPFTYGESLIHYPSGSTYKWFCAPAISSGYVVVYDNLLDPALKVEQQAGAVKAIWNAIHGAQPGKMVDCNDATFDTASVAAVDLFSSVLNIPAYPKPARFDVGYRALAGRYEADRGRVIAAAAGKLGTVDGVAQMTVASTGLDVARYDILFANDPWKNEAIGPLLEVKGIWNGNVFEFEQDYMNNLRTGWYPIVLRVTETSGQTYDFFGGVLYQQ